MTGQKESIFFAEAELLFVRHNKLPETIAAALGVCCSTIHKWKKKGAWEEKRKAYLVKPRNLADRLMEALEKQVATFDLAEGLNPGAADAIWKTLCAIKRIERQADMRLLGITAMEEFVTWLRGQGTGPEELQLIGAKIRGWLRTLI